MIRVTYQYRTYFLYSAESVLECLRRNGVSVPNACRDAGCQSCLMRAVSGDVTERSQRGLRESLRAHNYFLACACIPESDLEISPPDQSALKRTVAEVISKEPLTPTMLRLKLQRWMPFDYRVGQAVNLYRGFELVRAYSIVGPIQPDNTIEIHVRKFDDGVMSKWIYDELSIGDTIELGEPFGTCSYTDVNADENLLLIGTGAGLSTLWGIVSDALAQGHKGRISLYHGVRDTHGLYLSDELKEFADNHSNFHYRLCISGDDVPEGMTSGRVSDVALKEVENNVDCRIFLSGNPRMIDESVSQLKSLDHDSGRLHTEPFYWGSGQSEPA